MSQLPQLPPKPQASLPSQTAKPRLDLLPARPQVPLPPRIETEQEKDSRVKKGLGSPPPPANPKKREEILARLEQAASNTKNIQPASLATSPNSPSSATTLFAPNGSTSQDWSTDSRARHPSTSSATSTPQDHETDRERSRTPSNSSISRSGSNGIILPQGNGWGDRSLPPSGPAADRHKGQTRLVNHQSALYQPTDSQASEQWQARNGNNKGKERGHAIYQSPEYHRSSSSGLDPGSHLHLQGSEHQLAPPPTPQAAQRQTNGYHVPSQSGSHSLNGEIRPPPDSAPPPPPSASSAAAQPPPPPPPTARKSIPAVPPALPLGPKSWFRESTKLLSETPPPPPEAEPEPIPAPPPLSFGHVPLPTELRLSSKKHERGWRCIYDPQLGRGSGSSKGKEVVRRYREDGDHLGKRDDPRKKLPDGGKSTTYGRKAARFQLDRVKYEWDSNSSGPRPPPPPRGLLVTGASPLTTQQALLQHFRVFGRVAESELKADPQTGQSLGIFWLKFAHDYDEDGNRLADAMDYQYEKIDHQRGDVCARRALESTNGTKVGINVVAVELDGDRRKYVRTYRLELGKRYPPRKKASSSSSSASSSKPSQPPPSQPPPSQPPPPPPPLEEAAPPPPPPSPAPSMYPSHHPLSGVGSQSRTMHSQPAISSPLAAARSQQASSPPIGAPTGPRAGGGAPGMPPPIIPTGPRGARTSRGGRGRGGYRGYQAPPAPDWNIYSSQAASYSAAYEAMPDMSSPPTSSHSEHHAVSNRSPATSTSASANNTLISSATSSSNSIQASQDAASRARSESISVASPLVSNGAASPATSVGLAAEIEPRVALSSDRDKKEGTVASQAKQGQQVEGTEAEDSAEESDDMDMGSDDEEDFTGKTPLAQIHNSQVFYGRRGRAGDRAAGGAAADRSEDTSAILQELDIIGMPYVFVSRTASMSSQISIATIKRHFSCFLPLWVRSDSQGWYVAFNSKDAANRCKMVLDKANLSGFQISIDVRPPPGGVVDREPLRKNESRRSRTERRQPSKYVKKRPKVTWTDEELAEEARDIILKELGDVFLRDLKNRVVNPVVSEFLSPNGDGGKFLENPPLNLITPRAQRWRSYRDQQEQKMEGREIRDGDREEQVKDEGPTNDSHGGSALPSFRKRQVESPHKKGDSHQPSKWSSALPDPPAPGPAPGPPPLSAQEKQRQMGDEIIAAAYLKIQERKAQLEAAAQQTAIKHAESVEEMRAQMENDEDLQAQVVAEANAQAEQLIDEEIRVPVTKKKGGKKATAKGKKGKKAEVEPITSPVDSPMAAVDLEVPASEQALLKQLKEVEAQSGSSTRASRPRSPTPDPFEVGIAETDEDLYYVQIALERMTAGEPVVPEGAGDNAGLESGLAPSAAVVDDADRANSGAGQGLSFENLLHSSGSARTQGFYRIPPSQKAAHLPDRNQATVDASTVSTHALASARNNRADSRKVLLGIEQHKKDTATDTDILKFNQLGSRKKQLRFSKSPIHDWGLYAMELIPAGDMVIEYVGEVIRQQVADNREKQYERQGNFSTYLFRVDDDLVVDATHKGNIARLMNHCCTPNATAKILTLNGEKRIVIYAKNTILPGQELTYDYKFQSTGQEEDAIACLCGSPQCRRFL